MVVVVVLVVVVAEGARHTRRVAAHAADAVGERDPKSSWRGSRGDRTAGRVVVVVVVLVVVAEGARHTRRVAAPPRRAESRKTQSEVPAKSSRATAAAAERGSG